MSWVSSLRGDCSARGASGPVLFNAPVNTWARGRTPHGKISMTSINKSAPVPDWDLEQLEVILEGRSTWQLVNAGPGAGKSAVACQRIAYLVDDGVPAARILLVSFTRTAVAELRDRINTYAVAGERARSVRIATIDSHAWSLRIGFDDHPLLTVLGDSLFDLSIERTVKLFREKQPDLCDFMNQLEHLVIDEAQDVMSVRADLILEMFRSVSDDCGVTILADPAQAIYGFTTDDRDASVAASALLDRLDTECPRPLLRRNLHQIHRIKSSESKLADMFLRTRREIECVDDATGHVARVQHAIRETCGRDVGVATPDNFADVLSHVDGDSTLVLFRRRADVLSASSYCSQAGLEHRLRMSNLPVVIRPWLGWLFGEVTQTTITREEFDKLWDERRAIAAEPFAAEQPDACWRTLHQLSAAARPSRIDLVLLRSIVARSRPPLELCHSELGDAGPILGTIHASKGREADIVMLVMPPPRQREETGPTADTALVFEEGRVYYVGATRARQMLVAARGGALPVGYLESNRIYRSQGPMRAQLEVGRDGDVDRIAHLAWSRCTDVQRALASSVGRTLPLRAKAMPDDNYSLRLVLEDKDNEGVARVGEIGQMSEPFRRDLNRLWSRVDIDQTLRPAGTIPHLHLVAVTTVGVSEEESSSVRPPFGRSRLALAPVVKGFPMVGFRYRRGRTYS